MTRNRAPPRRSSRVAGAGVGANRGGSGSGNTEANTNSAGYGLAAAQQAVSGSGPGTFQNPTACRSPTILARTAPSAAESSHAGSQPDYPNSISVDPGGYQSGTEPPAPAPTQYSYSIYNHGTWTADDDGILIQARSRGQNWSDLQRAHFPTKTANACRKRYERLVERRGIHDNNGRRLEKVACEYMKVRKEIWLPLAERVAMHWETVEAMCMGSGMRTIQSNARSYTNRARRDSRLLQSAREAETDIGSVPSTPTGGPSPPGLLPAGTAFEPGFAGHNVDHPHRIREVPQRSDTELMPPPPFIPSSRRHSTGRLPPIAPAPPGHSLEALTVV